MIQNVALAGANDTSFMNLQADGETATLENTRQKPIAARAPRHFRRRPHMLFGVIATIQEVLVLLSAAVAGVFVDTIVDCTSVTHCHAAALQSLLALRTELRRHGKTMSIVGVSDSIRWRFDLIGLDVGADVTEPILNAAGEAVAAPRVR